MLQRAEETNYININCVDPLGRSALLMAIDNENLEMVELLIEHKVETKDALLHAISEEFVEAVEVLLDHEETLHKPGEPHVSTPFYWYTINQKCSPTVLSTPYTFFNWMLYEAEGSFQIQSSLVHQTNYLFPPNKVSDNTNMYN